MERTILDKGWKLRQIEPARSLKAPIISGADADTSPWIDIGQCPPWGRLLKKKGVIKTPWFGSQAKECLWVAQKDWVYSTTFRLGAVPPHATLVFGGLDTIVDIWLNGNLIASHDSMYVPVRVDVGGFIKTENILTLHFRTVFDLSSGKAAPIWFVDDDPLRPVRRSQQNYSDYLGPHPSFPRRGVRRYRPGNGGRFVSG